jgi:hypothetical protein
MPFDVILQFNCHDTTADRRVDSSNEQELRGQIQCLDLLFDATKINLAC